MAFSQVATQVLALVTSVLVARFLGPFEVGLAAAALVFASLALVIVDFGFASVIVQRPVLTETERSTAFWAGTGVGGVLMLAGIGLSWPIAALYGEPEVQPLVAAMSVAFLLTAPGIVQGALLTRELAFRSLELRTVVATTAASAAAIALAATGAGPWAIVAQLLVLTGVSTALLWRSSPWRPSRTFSVPSLRSMLGHTSNVLGAHVLEWGTLNLDNFLVGRFVGTAQLGAYSVAFSTMITPVNRIAAPIAQVFFPTFSRLREPARVASVWMRAGRMVGLVVVPGMLGLIVVAPDFVHALFGDRWEAAIPVIQILAPVGLIQGLMTLNAVVLQSLDRTRELFRFTFVLSLATVAGFAAGLPWGIEGVAVGYLVVTLLLQPFYLRLTARAAGTSPREWLRSMAGVLEAGAAMALVVFGLRELLIAADVVTAPRLLLLIAAGAATFVPLALWRDPAVLGEIRALRERRRVGDPGGEAA